MHAHKYIDRLQAGGVAQRPTPACAGVLKTPFNPCAADVMLCDLFLRCRVLCDAAILDAGEMKWSAVEPTPFSRCAHSGVLMARQSSPATGEACAACQARPAAQGTAPYLVLSLTWLALPVTCSAGTILALTGFAHHIWCCLTRAMMQKTRRLAARSTAGRPLSSMVAFPVKQWRGTFYK